MRKIDDSSNVPSKMRLRACAEGKITAEGLFDDHPRVASAAGLSELFDNHAEQRRRNRQIERWALRRAEFAAQGLKGREVVVVAIDVAQQAIKFAERNFVDAAVLDDALAGTGAELIDVPARLGDADHRHIQAARFGECLERGENLLVRQITGGAKEHEGIGMGRVHQCGSLLSALFDMSTELEAHCREQLVLKIGIAARSETGEKGGAQHRHRHRLVNGGLDRPAPFARVGNAPGELRQLLITRQRRRRQVEQP